MIKNTITLFFCFFVSLNFAQNKKIQLSNALVIGQMDKSEDRYTSEINIAEILNDNGIKAWPSLNVLKSGSNSALLSTDSIQKMVAQKGYDTYLIVTVRGYDKKFKVSTNVGSLESTLNNANLFPIFRDEIASVTFEFYVFRNGKHIGNELLRCNAVSSRDDVVKKFRKRLVKMVKKNWR